MNRVVVSDVSQCNGCRMCEMVCSFCHTGQFQPSRSHIKIYKIESKGIDMPVIAPTCDLCEGGGNAPGFPQCVKYCPTVVLKYDESGLHVLDRIRLESEARKRGALQ